MYQDKPDLSVNWNRELLGDMNDNIEKWHAKMLIKVKMYCKVIDDQLRKLLDHIKKSIEASPGNPGLKSAARRDRTKFDRRIIALSSTLTERSFQKLKEVYLLTTTETDIGYNIAQLLTSTYEDAAISPGGTDSDRKRKKFLEDALLKAHFNGKTFLELFESTILDKLTTDLEDVFAEGNLGVLEECERFVALLTDSFLMKYYPTEHDLEALSWLKRRAPQYGKELRKIQDGYLKCHE